MLEVIFLGIFLFILTFVLLGENLDKILRCIAGLMLISMVYAFHRDFSVSAGYHALSQYPTTSKISFILGITLGFVIQKPEIFLFVHSKVKKILRNM